MGISMSSAIVTECRSCKARIFWCTLMTFEGGKPHPLEVEEREPERLLIAYNPISGTGLVLTAARMEARLEEFKAKGATFHASHFDACPDAGEHRAPAETVHPEQGSLL